MTNSAGESRIEEMDLLLQEVRSRNAMPLWELNAQRGRPTVQPFMWRYLDYRDLLYRAADLVPMELAEPQGVRVQQPRHRQALGHVVALCQPPGHQAGARFAPSHRHSPAALRLVIEGQGAYTAVNGEKSYMDPGDFVTTPSWTWHDHGNEGDVPMVWLDGLDVPFVQSARRQLLRAVSGRHAIRSRNRTTSRSACSARAASRRRGSGATPRTRPSLNYKFERTYEALKALAEATSGSPYDGVTVEYTNPLNGGPRHADYRVLSPRCCALVSARRRTGTSAAPSTTSSGAAGAALSRARASTGGPKGHVRRAVMVLPRARRRGGGRPLLLQRQPRPAGAQPLP